MNKLGFVFVATSYFVSHAAFALPSPNDVWDCLKSSDPAIESDGDGSPGSNPILCHLLTYTVTELPKALRVVANFSCVMDDGKRMNLTGSADCSSTGH